MKKKIVWIIGAFIIVIGLNMSSLKSSPLDNFPVPLTAQVEETYDDKNISYEWNGINRLYHFQVQLAGWRKVDQMGSFVFYSKGGKKIGLLTSRGSFYISKER
ncbi:hypothetical protein J2S09_005504 [Bacillus fengqiuensis]|nr:hypothetical protein [Bacillus fengqiuensis]